MSNEHLLVRGDGLDEARAQIRANLARLDAELGVGDAEARGDIPGLTPKGLWRLGWDRAEEKWPEDANKILGSDASQREKDLVMEGYRAFKNGEKRK